MQDAIAVDPESDIYVCTVSWSWMDSTQFKRSEQMVLADFDCLPLVHLKVIETRAALIARILAYCEQILGSA